MKKGGSRVEQYLAAIKEGREVFVSCDIPNETVALLVDSLDEVWLLVARGGARVVE